MGRVEMKACESWRWRCGRRCLGMRRLPVVGESGPSHLSSKRGNRKRRKKRQLAHGVANVRLDGPNEKEINKWRIQIALH